MVVTNPMSYLAELNCPDPGSFTNATNDPPNSNRSLGTTLTFTCNSGLQFPNNVTAKTLTCEGNPGSMFWSPTITQRTCYGNAYSITYYIQLYQSISWVLSFELVPCPSKCLLNSLMINALFILKNQSKSSSNAMNHQI